jgi:hypothetical protein
VSQVVPSDVWLVTLNATSPVLSAPVDASTGAIPKDFIVTGCTYSQASVARFLARLAVVPDLSDVTLGNSVGAGGDATASTAASGVCPNSMVTFTIQSNLRAAGATS